MSEKKTNKPKAGSVPTDLLKRNTVSTPILNGETLRDSDVVGTLTLVKFNERIFLVTCNHVLRRWKDHGPLQSPIFEIETKKDEAPKKWLTVDLKRFNWGGLKTEDDEDDDGYYDLRVALLPKRENDHVISSLILPISPASEIDGQFTAVLTGFPEKKNTKDKIRKRKPTPWAKAWWYELFNEETPAPGKRIEFDWSHKTGNYMYEQQISEDSAKFVSTGSAPPPFGTSGGPLIFLNSATATDAIKHSVIGYGLEYDEERKKIIVGPSEAIIEIGLGLLKLEAESSYPTIYDPIYY